MAASTGTRGGSPRVTGYDTTIRYFANRYKQGGRVVYALNLSPLQVISTITRPDPSQATPGNRAITLAHAQGFAKYFREHESWVVPGMILRVPHAFEFEIIEEVEGAEFGVLVIPRQETNDIQILDGQHRILGFYLAQDSIAHDLDRARSRLATTRKVDPEGVGVAEVRKEIAALEDQRKRFERERVDLTIVVEPDPVKYKQMFFDIADNAKGITGSVKARFDNRKVVNRSLEAVMAHPLLANRVDIEADRTGRGSIYLMGAKHVAEIIKSVIVGLEGRVSRRQDDEWKESDVAEKATAFLDTLLEAFPPLKAVTLGQLLPDDLRNTSLSGSVLMLRVLAGTYFELIAHHAFNDKMVREFFAKLAPHMSAPVYEGSIWLEHTVGIFDDNARAPHSRRQDLKALKDTLVDWAIEKPSFIDEAPAPRPAPPGVDLDVSEEEADAELRPEIARARKEHARA